MKKSLIFALALMLVLAFASSAMAAQAFINGGYQSTTSTGVYRLPAPMPDGSTFSRTYADKKFTPDGISNYPYEIYLPNEKDPASYRIHSSYSKATDACASCHSTHTAVGDSLLQWYSAYETCMACHDGTVTTTYNVQGGVIGAGSLATGGTPAFGGMFDTSSGSGSNHNVTGSMAIAAAPGGSVIATAFTDATKTVAKNWTVEFGCQSCHTPHGLGGNARILHPDPNNAASDRAIRANFDEITAPGVKTATAGVVPTLEGTDYVVKPAGNTVDAVTYATYNGYYYLSSYPYAVRMTVKNEIYKANGNFTVNNSSGYSKISVIAGSKLDAAIIAQGAANLKVLGTPSMKVTMEVQGYLQPTEKVIHNSGMNAYCGACHTDYNTATQDAATFKTGTFYNDNQFTGSAAKETGVYSKAHRHQVGYQWHGDTPGLKFERGQKGAGDAWSYTNENRYGVECLTCHVAHGTSYDYWKATLATAGVTGPSGDYWDPGNGVTTFGELKELSGSSALKRMPNMGTCEACHAMETGNQGYASNTFTSAVVASADLSVVPKNSFDFFINATIPPTVRDYVGSAACAGCHADVYTVWKSTYVYTAETSQTAYTAETAAKAGLDASYIGKPADIGKPVDHGHASTNSFKSQKGSKDNTANAASCDHASVKDTSGMGGTTFSCHGIGQLLTATNTNRPASFAYNNIDAGITCEVCHGSGAKHIQAPTRANIFNPANAKLDNLSPFQTNVLGCLKCHGVLNGTEQTYQDTLALTNSATPAQVLAAGTQPVGTHGSSQYNYGVSKHYSLGIASCTTCHDPHYLRGSSGTKVPYEQLCTSCHDSAGTIQNTMGGGALHSFEFGMKGQQSIPSGSTVVIAPQRPKTNAAVVSSVYSAWDKDITNAAPYKIDIADKGHAASNLLLFTPAGKLIATNLDLLTAPAGTFAPLTITWTPTGSQGVAPILGLDYNLSVGANSAQPTVINFTYRVGIKVDYTGTVTTTWAATADPTIKTPAAQQVWAVIKK